MSLGNTKLGWYSAPYRSAYSPIIIGGCGRSGTTLLRVMLNAHPNLFIGPENGVFSEGGRNFPGMSEALDLTEQELICEYRASCCLGEFVERILAMSLEKTGKARWGIKAPNVINSVPTVFHFFPLARLIHVLRDGRDVVTSLRHHPKYRWENGKRVPTGISNPWGQCVERWLRDTKDGLVWRQDNRYAEVRYEDLVQAPEKVLHKLVDWIGEPWDDSMMNYHSQHIDRHSDAPNPGVNQPVYQGAVGRWRDELPTEGREAFTPEACNLLVQLKYAEDNDWRKTPV